MATNLGSSLFLYAIQVFKVLILCFCLCGGKNFRYVEKQSSEKQVALLTNDKSLKVGIWIYLLLFYSFFPFIKTNIHKKFIELILFLKNCAL